MLTKKQLKIFRLGIRNFFLKHKCTHLTVQLTKSLKNLTDTIPVFVVSYNNGIYVKNMVDQLNHYSINPIIFDNNSTCKKTLRILKILEEESKAKVLYSKYNFGHMVGFLQPIYDLLPEVFAYTDPDLQLNDHLPTNFMEVLSNLTIEFPVYKAGFALSLHNHGALKDIKLHCLHSRPIKFNKHLSIEEFESRYWIYRLKHDNLELYGSPIDTTFALYRKSNYIGDFHRAIRVAGKFSAIHLPWFEELDLFTNDDKDAYLKKNTSSNWIKNND